eukprot:m.48004 g.48004  ORF g.48004 m.48004 type:complete len:420 (-) comp8891_c0_seq1:50-1309(-)
MCVCACACVCVCVCVSALTWCACASIPKGGTDYSSVENGDSIDNPKTGPGGGTTAAAAASAAAMDPSGFGGGLGVWGAIHGAVSTPAAAYLARVCILSFESFPTRMSGCLDLKHSRKRADTDCASKALICRASIVFGPVKSGLHSASNRASRVLRVALVTISSETGMSIKLHIRTQLYTVASSWGPRSIRPSDGNMPLLGFVLTLLSRRLRVMASLFWMYPLSSSLPTPFRYPQPRSRQYWTQYASRCSRRARSAMFSRRALSESVLRAGFFLEPAVDSVLERAGPAPSASESSFESMASSSAMGMLALASPSIAVSFVQGMSGSDRTELMGGRPGAALEVGAIIAAGPVGSAGMLELPNPAGCITIGVGVIFAGRRMTDDVDKSKLGLPSRTPNVEIGSESNCGGPFSACCAIAAPRF